MTLAVIERPHAKISPSSFERVEKCSQSVRLSEHSPPRLAGPEAQAGTAAHHLLETCLKEGLDTFELSDITTLQVDGHEVEVDDEMLDAVQLALDWVRANMPAPLAIEKKVRFPFADPYLGSEMFGWIDIGTSAPPWIVADAKFGFNLVGADSIQLALYLLGLALEHDPELSGSGHAGTTVVIQPQNKAEPVRDHTYSWADLRMIRNRVIAALKRVQNHEWFYAYGEWCRYCPAAGICPHLRATMMDPALTIVSPSAEAIAAGDISREQLEAALDRVDILEIFLKQLNAVAESYVIHGGKLRNRKLVRKKTNRRWIDERKAVEKLTELQVDPYTKPSVIGPAEAERRLPKGKRAIINTELAEKPPGDLTLVSRDDTRPEIDVGATLRAALASSVAAGYLAAVTKPPGQIPANQKGEKK